MRSSKIEDNVNKTRNIDWNKTLSFNDDYFSFDNKQLAFEGSIKLLLIHKKNIILLKWQRCTMISL